MPLIEQIYVRTENGIYDVTYWSQDNNGYYTYFTDDWCEPKQYIYKDDIIKTANNLEDLIDEYRYTATYETLHCNKPHSKCECYNDVYIRDYACMISLTNKELATVKGYIWIGDNLICVAEMKEYGDGYQLFLKEREQLWLVKIS